MMSLIEVKMILNQQIKKLAVKTLNKMFLRRCCGLHLNFCERRSITNNSNQTITTNDGNNDNTSNSSNSNGNDVSDKTESQERFY